MGLVINSTTGVIDVSASTVGTYNVVYTVGNVSATTQVTIENCDSGGGSGEDSGDRQGSRDDGG